MEAKEFRSLQNQNKIVKYVMQENRDGLLFIVNLERVVALTGCYLKRTLKVEAMLLYC